MCLGNCGIGLVNLFLPQLPCRSNILMAQCFPPLTTLAWGGWWMLSPACIKLHVQSHPLVSLSSSCPCPRTEYMWGPHAFPQLLQQIQARWDAAGSTFSSHAKWLHSSLWVCFRAGLRVIWAESEVRSQAGKMQWVESHLGNFWDAFWALLGIFLPIRLHMGLGAIRPFMLLLLPWLLIWMKRLLGKEESLEAKKLPFCAYAQSSQGPQEKSVQAGLGFE